MITHLAPAPDRASLKYDECQFERLHMVAPACRESGIAMMDYSRMQTVTYRSARHRSRVSAWSQNEKQFQHVLAQRVWRFCGKSGFVPEKYINDRAALSKLADKCVAKQEKNEVWKQVPPAQRLLHETHMAAIRRAGGFMQLQALLMWRAYRDLQDSVQIAESLGITPANARQSIFKANQIARTLGYECCTRRSPMLGRKFPGRKSPLSCSANGEPN
jgi:hypothetical protein